MKKLKENSAGGVVYRKKQGKVGSVQTIEWLISKHSGYHKWVLPKGIVENDETAEEAALREVREETGIKAEIIKKIDFEVKYKYKKPGLQGHRTTGLAEDTVLVDKTVEFYLMKCIAGDVKDHNWEMEDAKWVSAKKALELLGFETERKVLKMAMELA